MTGGASIRPSRTQIAGRPRRRTGQAAAAAWIMITGCGRAGFGSSREIRPNRQEKITSLASGSSPERITI
jgi:hypothetical protein